jgi:hypothetical protein
MHHVRKRGQQTSSQHIYPQQKPPNRPRKIKPILHPKSQLRDCISRPFLSCVPLQVRSKGSCRHKHRLIRLVALGTTRVCHIPNPSLLLHHAINIGAGETKKRHGSSHASWRHSVNPIDDINIRSAAEVGGSPSLLWLGTQKPPPPQPSPALAIHGEKEGSCHAP